MLKIISKRLYALLIISSAVICPCVKAEQSGIRFHPENDALYVPEGFQVSIVAEGIGKARHLVVRDNGDIYVAMRRSHSGKCLAALRDEDDDGVVDIIHYFADFDECGSVGFHGQYLYFSNLETVYRLALKDGLLVPPGPVEVVATGFAKNGPWHGNKIIAFDESENLYINVGAPSNACQEKWRTAGSPGMRPCPHLDRHAGIWKFRANEIGQDHSVDAERYATGIRNGVALAWNPLSKALYTIPHGRDLLHHLWPAYYSEIDSAELPAEEFFKLHEGFNGGWPYTYYDHRKGLRMLAPEYGGDGRTPDRSEQYGAPIATFPGHWGPNDLIFYTGKQFPKKYYGGAFVAFVGGWNRAPYPQQGYKVVFVPFDESGLPTGEPVSFVDNFTGKPEVGSPDEAQYRPTGLAQGPDGSLYIADSVIGRIWRVVYTGKKGVSRMTQQTGAPTARPESQDKEHGAEAYMTHCASCHMENGSGVPGFQPALKKSRFVNGEEGKLLSVILEGRADGKFANNMPAFAHLDDETIARISSYIRNHFGNWSAPVSPDAVREHRQIGKAD